MKTLALVGRTNVGKSTIFNRFAGFKSAIVSNQEALTRDKKAVVIKKGNKVFNLVDTGGFFPSEKGNFDELVFFKTQEAIQNADLILFVVDKKFGLSPFDSEISKVLRKSEKKVFLLINKIDFKEGSIEDFKKLGFEDVFEISAEHNLGFEKLIKRILKHLPENETQEDINYPKITIIGKPNVGKSSLLNAISKQDLMITSPFSGTTIDAVEFEINYKGKKYRFVDTAGVKKKSKTILKEEKLSTSKSFSAIEYADLCLMVLDGSDQFNEQDLKLISKINDVGRSMIIVINKLDLFKGEEKKVLERLALMAPYLDSYPKVFLSALQAEGLKNLFNQIYRVQENSDKDIKTNKLNDLLHEALEKQPLPYKSSFKPKIRFVHQGGKNPHIITMHGNSLNKIDGSYKRYLIKFFSKKLNLLGVNVKLKFLNTKNPFNTKK